MIEFLLEYSGPIIFTIILIVTLWPDLSWRNAFPDKRKVLVAPPCKLQQLNLTDEVSQLACKAWFVKDHQGGPSMVIEYPSGTESLFALNNYSHKDGHPLTIQYHTGDQCWFNPDGSVYLVRDSSGRYWK